MALYTSGDYQSIINMRKLENNTHEAQTNVLFNSSHIKH